MKNDPDLFGLIRQESEKPVPLVVAVTADKGPQEVVERTLDPPGRHVNIIPVWTTRAIGRANRIIPSPADPDLFLSSPKDRRTMNSKP